MERVASAISIGGVLLATAEAKGRRERDDVGNVVVNDNIVVVKNNVVRVSMVVRDVREVKV